MIADPVRMRAYHDALARVLTPGAVVLDLGAGTGIMSLLACKLGAGKVYAVEPSDALVVGIELARANGFADRIEFIQASSLDVTLPTRADVVVHDLRGVLPLHELLVPSIVDARQRLLAPGGALIPARDVVRAQLVCDESLHERASKIWRDGVSGLDLLPGLRWAAHAWRKADLSGSALIGAPRDVFTIDYRTVEQPDAAGQCSWTMEAAVTAHGLAAWFDAELAPGVGLSNAPDQPRAIYGQIFFPFEQALPLAPGDRVGVTLSARLVAGDYVWQWHTEVRDERGVIRKKLRQSSFQATPVNPARLASRSGDFVPKLRPEGRAAALALTLMEQHLPVEAIAAQLVAKFPEVFAANPGRARDLVADLGERFAERG